MDLVSTPLNDENAARHFGGTTRGKEFGRSRSFGSALKENAGPKGGKSEGKRRVLGNITNSAAKQNLLKDPTASNSKSISKGPNVARSLRILEVEEVQPRRLQLAPSTSKPQQLVTCDLDPAYVKQLANEYARDGVSY
eukprot:scaffold65_cov353-Prasinococcus_capsulatus_cf.AAC.14